MKKNQTSYFHGILNADICIKRNTETSLIFCRSNFFIFRDTQSVKLAIDIRQNFEGMVFKFVNYVENSAYN